MCWGNGGRGKISSKHVVLPAGAYLSLTAIYRTDHTEKTIKIGCAVHNSVEFPPEKNPQEQNNFCVVFLSISFGRQKYLNIFHIMNWRVTCEQGGNACNVLLRSKRRQLRFLR